MRNKLITVCTVVIALLYSCQNTNTHHHHQAISAAVQCCQTIADIYEAGGHAVLPDSLLECLASSLDVLEKFPQDTSLQFTKAQCYLNQSYHISILRDFEAGIKAALISEQLLEQKTDQRSSSLLTGVYNELSILYQKVGNIDLAVAYSELAKQRYETAGSMDLVAIEYTNQGMIWSGAGDYERAKYNVEKAIKIYEDLDAASPDNFTFLGAYNALAIAYQGLAIEAKNSGNMAKAQQYFDQTISLYQYNSTALYPYRNDDYVAEYYHKTNLNMGIALYHKGLEKDLDSTVVLLKKAIDGYAALFKEKTVADAAYGMVVLATVLARQHQFDSSFEWLQKGLTNLNYSTPTVFDNPPVDIEKVQIKNLLIQALALKGQILKDYYAKTKQKEYLVLSFQVLQNALELMEETVINFASDASLTGLKNRFYPIYSATILGAYEIYTLEKEEKYLKTAFELSEKSKEFALKQSISRKINQLQFNEDAQKLLTKDEHFRKRILEYEQRYFDDKLSVAEKETILDTLFRQKQAHHAYINQLKNSSNKIDQTYYKERFNHQVPTIEDIQKTMLDEKTALIEYHLGGEQALAFVITVHGVQIITLKNISKIWGKPLTTFKDGLTMELTTNEFVGSAHVLYQTLLKDIIAQLKGQAIEKLLIVPDQQLREIPFEALVTTLPKTDEFKDVDFVLKDFSVGYLYTLTTQGLLDEWNKNYVKPPLEFAAFIAQYGTETDTEHSEQDALTELGCTNRPIRAITAATTKNIVPLFAEPKVFYPAYESSFRDSAQYFKVLHLAMHGCIEEQKNPLTYNLLFSEGENSSDDATLTVGEILYQVPLQADLLVLASCNTEKRASLKSDRVATIARAFRQAGVANIIASLNSVNDETTATILTYFYQNLKTGLSKEKALQVAKVQYLNTATDRLNPKFWANLILIGKG